MRKASFISLLAKLTGERGSLTLRIIDVLDQMPEGISITQLSSKVGSPQPSVSRAIKRLIEVGLVEVKRARDRGKSFTIVRLTNAGETLALILSYADLLFSLYEKGENPILHHVKHLDLNEDVEEYKQHLDRITLKGRFALENLISLAARILRHEIDPFDLDLDSYIELLKEYHDIWKSKEDLLMDAEALLKAVKVLKAQRERLSHELKLPRGFASVIEETGENKLGKKLLSHMSPVFTPNTPIYQGLAKATAQLWLAPTAHVPKKPKTAERASIELDLEDARRMGVVDSKKFEEMLASLLTELRDKTSSSPIEYSEWILAPTFIETVNRAYLTSFLVKRGLATLRPGGDGKLLISPGSAERPRVVLTSVTYELWVEEMLRCKKIRK